MAKYGYSASASVRIWRVLIVAKSYDKLQIAIQNTTYDICKVKRDLNRNTNSCIFNWHYYRHEPLSFIFLILKIH